MEEGLKRRVLSSKAPVRSLKEARKLQAQVNRLLRQYGVRIEVDAAKRQGPIVATVKKIKKSP